MPTYEYACTSCKHQFEEFQSIKAPALKKCPECGKNALERLVGTGAALIFKGSGFYKTDYRSEAYKKAAEAESKPATPAADSKATINGEVQTGSKEPAKSEPAPAAKAEPRQAKASAARKPAKSAAKK
ncbi:MAG: hypothetical protein KF869_04510 [Phycisphaeraceae bacterium]|nr:hypothetical protein [Phycisphaeraceae bacterium]